jgi:hypothetical protein
MAMRKLYVPGLLLCAVIAGCETKTPSGPSGVTPTTSTTTTSVPPPDPTTTSSTTTTSVVIAALARRYTAFNPPANVPSEMTLFFELLGGAGFAEPMGAVTTGRNRATENEYKVTGVYIMGNGTTGTVTGELGGSDNPLETGGELEAEFTATGPSGCTALRDFAGTLTSQTLQLAGGTVGTTSNPCSPNPLTAFNSISMLRFDTGAPLPTPPPTTSSIATTTTTILCTYSLSASSDSVGSAGGVRRVDIMAPAGCAWSAQSFADWITVQPPYGGSGNATILYTVAATTAARSGMLLIGGIQFPVNQSAPVVLADLLPSIPAETACTFDSPRETYTSTVNIRNQGGGNAAGSSTGFLFRVSEGTPPTDSVPTNPIASGGSVSVVVDIPDGCFQFVTGSTFRCSYAVTADQGNAVAESNENNNATPSGGDGSCTIEAEGFAIRRSS